MGCWCGRRHGWGLARGDDGSGGRTGGGGVVRTGRDGAKKEVGKVKGACKGEEGRVQEAVALDLCPGHQIGISIQQIFEFMVNNND